MDDMCEAFLYAAARIQHLKDIVKPALNQGKIVFCDRFVHSSYVYQGLGRELGLDKIVKLNELAVGEYMPDFTIFLDLSPEQAFKRKGGADNKFEVIDAGGTAEQTQSLLRQALVKRGVFK